MNSYEEKKQARIDYYKEKSGKATQESQDHYNNYKKMVDVIPLGQPILVDHYSAKRDRNYRDRTFNQIGKSVEAQKKAEYYANKAEAAESNTAISSDDPEALTKLKGKLASLEEAQSDMKRINAYYRKNGSLLGCEGITDEEAQKIGSKIEKAYSWNKIPFASYSLTNNNAEIRRLKDRIKQLETKREFVGWEFEGGEVKVNNEINRLQIFFDEKPDEATRKELKGNAFKWSGKEKAWQRQLNENCLYAVNRIAFLKPIGADDVRSIQPKRPKIEKPIEQQAAHTPPKEKETMANILGEPKNSPWGVVQTCDKLCPGVFNVSTAEHGGVLFSRDMAVLLSPAARKCGTEHGGCICFEKNTQENVALRELLDKKLWSIPDRIKDKTAFEENINKSLKQHNPDYWRSRQTGIENAQARKERIAPKDNER